MRRALALAACLVAAGALLPAAAEAARKPPVVMILFDEFPGTTLWGSHGRIDRVRYPNFAALARDATWFRNATTVHDSTFASIPALLNGRPPSYHKGGHGRSHLSVLTQLMHNGYKVHGSAEATGVCPRKACPAAKGTRYYLVRRRIARLVGFFNKIKPEPKPTMWFKHVLLPHVPYEYLPSGRQYIRGVKAPIGKLSGKYAAHDRYLVRLLHQRHILQIEAVDTALGLLVRHLKAVGLYDKAVIIVAADHGISFGLGQEDRRTLTPGTFAGIASVPLFVKQPGQKRGHISGAFARTYDIAPTIASFARFRLPWKTSGRSLFSRAVRHRNTVRISGRSHEFRVLQASAGHYRTRIGRLVRDEHAIYGVGNRGPGLFGIGPVRPVLGRTVHSQNGRLYVDDRRVASARKVRAKFAQAGEIRNVKLASGFVPTLMAGRVRGGKGGTRALALGLNGRIVATARSFYIRGEHRESFAAMVPESRLREGHNLVQLFAVGRSHGHYTFRILGRV